MNHQPLKRPGGHLKRLLRAIIVLVLLSVIGVFILRPLFHLLISVQYNKNEIEELADGYTDDASRLNLTCLNEIWHIPVGHADPEAQLAQLLFRARSEGLKVSIAGAQHSMGGHTIYPDGIVVDMLPFNQMAIADGGEILHVQAGATWKDIIAYLDTKGLSVKIMQSNNSFTVGGSLSANCHGWQYGHPPIASSVESFRIMLANGTVVRCSRTENRELFSLALGGYGLFGIILDARLYITGNEQYRREQHVVPFEEALSTFDREFRGRDNIQMVYARMNIAEDGFLENVILNGFRRQEEHNIAAVKDPGSKYFQRAVFRGSAHSDYGKKVRWAFETKIARFNNESVFTRNQLLNDGAEIFENRSSSTTDILHEYFIPREQAVAYIKALQKIIPEHGANLLNVTIRAVNEDSDTMLRYADQPMIAFVMLFVQERNREGEECMRVLTQDLITTALYHQGRYYLPYRLHATKEQFHLAYPQAREFFAKKREYDPDELFQNRFYITYGLPE